MGTNEAEDLVTFVDELMMPVRKRPSGRTPCFPIVSNGMGIYIYIYICIIWLQLRNPTTGLQNRQLFGFVERTSWHFACREDTL